jgi:hypothetical protein
LINQSRVEAIKTADRTLMTIINDILIYLKIEADKMTFESVPFSLHKQKFLVIVSSIT